MRQSYSMIAAESTGHDVVSAGNKGVNVRRRSDGGMTWMSWDDLRAAARQGGDLGRIYSGLYEAAKKAAARVVTVVADSPGGNRHDYGSYTWCASAYTPWGERVPARSDLGQTQSRAGALAERYDVARCLESQGYVVEVR